MENNENMVADMNTTGARALLMGCACVVKSMLTPEQIEKFCIYDPEALVKKNEAGEAVFRIDLDGELPGSITPERAVFSKVKTTDGKATITVIIDPECEDRKAALMETVGPGLRQLEEMEPQLLAKLPDLAEKEKQAWDLFSQL